MSLKSVEEILKSELKSFKCHLKDVVTSSDVIASLTEHFTGFQGKHLRPILTMLSAKTVAPNKPFNENHFNLAVIVELLHNATLVHDDVLDEAKLRRNVKTYNQRWGNEMAIIFGDYLFARLFSRITKLESSKLLKDISDTANRICLGELNHLLKRFDPYGLPEKEYLEIIYNKTASLFALSTYLGAIASTKDKNFSYALKQYGKNFGMAYQIMDDYKDIAISEKTSGKSTGNDLFKGKITLPIIWAIRNVSKTHRNKIKNILFSVMLNGNSLSAKKKKLCKLLEQTGSLNYTHQQARNYVNLAIKALTVLKDSTYKELLASLAISIIN